MAAASIDKEAEERGGVGGSSRAEEKGGHGDVGDGGMSEGRMGGEPVEEGEKGGSREGERVEGEEGSEAGRSEGGEEGLEGGVERSGGGIGDGVGDGDEERIRWRGSGRRSEPWRRRGRGRVIEMQRSPERRGKPSSESSHPGGGVLSTVVSLRMRDRLCWTER